MSRRRNPLAWPRTYTFRSPEEFAAACQAFAAEQLGEEALDTLGVDDLPDAPESELLAADIVGQTAARIAGRKKTRKKRAPSRPGKKKGSTLPAHLSDLKKQLKARAREQLRTDYGREWSSIPAAVEEKNRLYEEINKYIAQEYKKERSAG